MVEGKEDLLTRGEGVYRYPTTAEELKEIIRVLSPLLVGEVSFKTIESVGITLEPLTWGYYAFDIPEGWVDIEPKAIEVHSDYYSNKIAFFALSDNVPILASMLVGPTIVDFGSQFIKRKLIQLRFYNWLDQTVHITVICHVGLVTERVFRKIITPLLEGLGRLVIGRELRV